MLDKKPINVAFYSARPKAVQRLAVTLDAQAMTRIIDAVETGAGRKFPDIDRAALQRDVELARTHYDDMSILGNKTHGGELSRKVKLIRKSAQQILDKMDVDVCEHLDGNAGVIDPYNLWREDSKDIRRAVQYLITLIDYKHPPSHLVRDPERLLGWSGSPFERIAGRYLRKVFEAHFEPTAGYRYYPVEGEVRGPYIDFVEQALIELGIFNKGVPYMRQSIADAFTTINNQERKRENLAVR